VADTESDTEGVVPGCECIPQQDEDPNGSTAQPLPPTCGDSLCAEVVADCENGGKRNMCLRPPFTLEDPAALECALTALRDRTAGRLDWNYTASGGVADQFGYILILDDGRAVLRSWSIHDLEFEAEDAELGELADAATFDACLAEADDLARFDCMRNALASTTAVCNEGWSGSKAGA
jgi:hypothetical protein